jgi:hypothetical protein
MTTDWVYFPVALRGGFVENEHNSSIKIRRNRCFKMTTWGEDM